VSGKEERASMESERRGENFRVLGEGEIKRGRERGRKREKIRVLGRKNFRA